MSLRFEGKHAVVTGAASGIGRQLAKRFVSEGGTAIGGDLNEADLETLRAELSPHLIAQRCDVTHEEDVADLVEMCIDQHGSIDAMFNVAGHSRSTLIVDMSEVDWDFTVDVCLKSVFFGIKHAAQRMIACGRGGVIVSIASLNSRVPMKFGSAYAAAKAGVVSLTESAAIELGQHNICVNAVSPGLTATPLVEPVITNPKMLNAFLDRIPLGRPAEPDEIASAALYLASEEAAYITGVNLFVDGGWKHTAYPDLNQLGAPS